MVKRSFLMKKYALGIEFGSTRIKAVAIDDKHIPVSSRDYTWKSTYENGIWTYDLAQVWEGLRAALAGVSGREDVGAVGIFAQESRRPTERLKTGCSALWS